MDCRITPIDDWRTGKRAEEDICWPISHFLHGLIDDIRIYSRALSARRSANTVRAEAPPVSIESHTYSLVKGNGDVDNGSFTVDGDKLVASESFDFEGKKNLSVRVRSTDAEGLFVEKALLVTVTNANDPPSDILLDPDPASVLKVKALALRWARCPWWILIWVRPWTEEPQGSQRTWRRGSWRTIRSMGMPRMSQGMDMMELSMEHDFGGGSVRRDGWAYSFDGVDDNIKVLHQVKPQCTQSRFLVDEFRGFKNGTALGKSRAANWNGYQYFLIKLANSHIGIYNDSENRVTS